VSSSEQIPSDDVPPQVPGDEGGAQDLSPEQWQALDALWKTILGLEVSIDTLRLNMETLRAEMEAAFKKQLAVEEKVHALQADVAQWTKAKNRVHYALPKVREFIHRATWALAVPERKRMEEVVESHIEPRVPLPQADEVRDQLGHLQKDRQVLFAQGNSVYQECRGILAEIQRAHSTLQRNAADRARAKRSAGREKGKYF
jgi:chromosome segregation ATPase